MEEIKPPQNKSELYSALVWILAGFSLVTYCTLGLLNASIPGVEELVKFLSSIDGKYIYIAAFVSVFIEGLYFIGNFFPGSTLIVLISVISQLSGYFIFIMTIISIFIGWSLASVVNIFLAKVYHLKIANLETSHDFEIKDRIWTTWFPAFRANYEVAQVTSGGHPYKVFFSSIRVKLLTTIFAGVCVQIVPFFIDINNLNNEEGFASVLAVALISFIVGGLKIKKYYKNTTIIPIRPISWDEVFSKWENQEAELEHWVKHYKERGFSSWKDWRKDSFKEINPELLNWNLYEIKNPSQTVANFYSGPFRSWKNKFYNENESMKFSELVLNTEIQNNKNIINIIKNFPEDSFLIGLKNSNKIIIIDGLHRSCALALSNLQKKPINNNIFLICADFSGKIPLLGKENSPT